MNKTKYEYANLNTDFIDRVEGINDSDRYVLKRMFETGIRRAAKDERIRCVMIMQRALNEMRGVEDG